MNIGLLFQLADDLIDYNGNLLAAGKKTGKDKKKGKATLISLLGDKNTIKYANKLILKINTKLKKYGPKSKNLTETLNYILNISLFAYLIVFLYPSKLIRVALPFFLSFPVFFPAAKRFPL